MRFALASVGSLGDVLPFCAIGQALVRKGHQVHLLANAQFSPLAAAHGLRFAATGTEADASRTESHPLLWHPIDGFGVLWRYLCVPALEPTFDRLSKLLDEANDELTVLSSPLALGARMLRDQRRFPLLSCSLAPSNIRSTADPMFVGSYRVPRSYSTRVRSAIWKSVDVIKLQPMARQALGAWRIRLGLTPIRESIFGSWMHSPDRCLALFPEWFGQQRADGLTVQYCGFPFSEEIKANDDTLERFLGSGSQPIVVYPGSSARSANRFLSAAISAARDIGIRVVLVTRFHEHLPNLRPGNEHCVVAADFMRLLPRCRAVIHHGGIGSCASALRAGIPQVIVPSSYDQFDNGFRIERIGAGVVLNLLNANYREHLSRALRATYIIRNKKRADMPRSWNGAELAATAAIAAAEKGKARA